MVVLFQFILSDRHAFYVISSLLAKEKKPGRGGPLFLLQSLLLGNSVVGGKGNLMLDMEDRSDDITRDCLIHFTANLLLYFTGRK